MTLVRIKVNVPEVSGLVPALGALRWTPTRRRVTSDTVVLPKGFTAELTNGIAAVEVAPTSAEWVWRVDEVVPGVTTKSRYLVVPNLPQVEYVTLIEVDPATLVPTADADPAWYAYVDTLSAQASISTTAAEASKVAAEDARDSATGSQASAAASASTATTKASEASGSASNAATSADTASGHKDAAAGSAGSALASRNAAHTSELNAGGSANAAAQSDTHASDMAVLAQDKASETLLAANGFTIGTVTTGAPGSAAAASITGTAPDKKLNLGLPQGETGPPNTLTVLGTVTGPETPGATGAQGFKGDKGDPGPFATDATSLAGADLNAITTPGIYGQSNGALVLTSMNYPITYNSPISMVVYRNGSTGVQEMTFSYAVAGGRVTFRRTWSGNGTVWTPWRAFNSTRVDNTAGRAIYQWDDLNNREQLIYGDTGWRDVSAVVTRGVNMSAALGTFLVRRIGSVIHWSILNMATTDNPGNIKRMMVDLGPAGVGWMPKTPTFIGVGRTEVSSTGPVTEIRSALYVDGKLWSLSGYLDNSMSGTFSYTTDAAWPTTLPGSASGAIPNV